jgi:hypothetical protein
LYFSIPALASLPASSFNEALISKLSYFVKTMAVASKQTNLP